MRLRQRVEALESRDPEWRPWHHAIQHVGQTQEEAIAVYEAEHGPLGDDNLILSVIVEPKGARANAIE